MKAETVKTPEPKGFKPFQPFQLTIKVETEKELWNLWHRFNISAVHFTEEYHKWYKNCKSICTPDATVWNLLDKVMDEYKIERNY